MKKHDCFHFEEEPAKRERPEWAGPADTTPVGQYWDVQHKPCPPVPDCGYGMPPLMPPIPPFNPNLSMPGQVEALTHKVNDLIKTLNCYSDNVYGAYNAIVQSALCNDAYYREVTIEEGYIPDASAKYKVVHIPFLDKAGEPIYLELGLAYNNSTNSGVREKSFDASQRFLADKLIPAANVGTNWYGHPIWKNAPIPTTEVEGMKYTVGITESGFIKWYANSVDDRTMQIDKVRNAMGVRSVLIAGGELSQNMWETNESTQLARVGIGMNYQTKERFIVVVEGSDRTGCTVEQFANIFNGYACDVAVECANGDSSYMLDKGEMAVMPSTVNAMSIPTVPDSNCFWYITKRRHYKNQYVKDVAVLTQRVGQEIWNTELADTAVDKVKAEVVDLNNRLVEEIQNRKDGDARLDSEIAEESENRINGDKVLDERITAEVKTLNKRIDSEVEKLNAVDAKLREDLSAETQNRIDNDIASVELVQDGTKDIYRLKKNDGTAIEVPIEVYNYTLLVQKLDTLSQVEVRLNAEIEARKSADDALGAKIDKEVADRTQADVALKALINAEETARTAGDTDLANQIKALTTQFTDFKNATEGDIAGIEVDIEGLTENLNNLTSTVSNNKTELERKLTDLTARVTAEETTTADNVDKIAKLNAQINTLQTTISALNETVTALQNSFASTEQSFENVKQTVANMQTELNTFEETVNAKFGEYLPLTGGTMKGNINLNLKSIFEAFDITFSPGVQLRGGKTADRNYLQALVPNKTNKVAIKAADAVEDDELVTKSQMENADANYLPLSGGTMTGTLTFDATKFGETPEDMKPFFVIDVNGHTAVSFNGLVLDMKDFFHAAGTYILYNVINNVGRGFALTDFIDGSGNITGKLVKVTYDDSNPNLSPYNITDERIPLSVGEARQGDEAVTKSQLDKMLPLAGGTMRGELKMGTYGISDTKDVYFTNISKTKQGAITFSNDGELGIYSGEYGKGLSAGTLRIAPGTSSEQAVNKGQLDNIITSREIAVAINEITINGKTDEVYAPVLLAHGTFTLTNVSIINIIPPVLDNALNVFVTVNRTSDADTYRFGIYAINTQNTSITINAQSPTMTCYYKQNF